MTKYVPHKRVTIRKSLPWLTHALSLLFKKRDRLHHRAKTLNSPAAWLSYRKARNRAVSAIRSAKKKFFSNLSSLVKTPKEFWSAYHSLLPNRQRIPAMLSNGSITAESTASKCDLLNCHFAEVFSDSSPDLSFNSPVPNPSPPELSNISCSRDEVLHLLSSIPRKTSSGPDGISSAMLRNTATAITSSLTKLFNRSLSLGQVPVDWKLSNITPVPKGCDPKLVSNYRPISLLSLPSEIPEHIIFNQLLSHLLTNSLLSNSQFGFHLSGHMQSVVLIDKPQNYQNWVVGACPRQYGTWVSISSDAESPSSKAQLYKSLVLPILDYCSSLWDPN